MAHDDPTDYLAPTDFVDSDHPAVVAYARDGVGDAATDRERAVSLFYRVRDDIRYDPYALPADRSAYRASAVVDAPAAYCIPKAILLAGAARAVGIPARLGFADVRNHLQSEKLRERMGTDLFVFHGYTELFLDDTWVKATPAFNIELCHRFGVRPLDFDGRHEALLHPYDTEGRRHMEYVHDRGTFADLPYDELQAAFAEHYPDHATGDPSEQQDELFHGSEPRAGTSGAA